MPFLPPDLSDSLQAALDKLKTAGNANTALNQLRALRQAVAEAERAIPGAQQGLDAFFGEVSNGMLTAQRHLDQQSARYSAESAAGQEGGMPTLFRIPKASAEFQFAMEESSSQGFNVLILSGERAKKETVHHKVSFDVVAVPPPPEMLQEILRERPLLARLLRQVAEDPATPEQKEREIAATLADHVEEALLLRGEGLSMLVLRREEPDGGHALLIALFTGPDAVAVMRIPHPATGWRQEVQRLVNALGETLAQRETAGG